MLQKQGFELAMNVIIIAAIALVVLVVVLLIFTGKIRSLNTELDSCPSKQGSCQPGPTCPAGSASVVAKCLGNGVCCIRLTNNP